jgi:DNA (cytosine-5)-methyltransferase 1
MNHLDLFSGIGGFALAAQWVWGEEHNIVSFCEIEPFAQKVLKKHWPDVPIIEDVRNVKGSNFSDVTLCTGGFPCQPFSVAGKQQGKGDHRFIWDEMCRVVSEVKPQWVIGENVPGLVSNDNGMVFEQICIDLEVEGYEVQPFIVPACAVDAPHRRDRVWIVANLNKQHDDNRRHGTGPLCRERSKKTDMQRCESDVGYSNSLRVERERPEQQTAGPCRRSKTISNSDCKLSPEPRGTRPGRTKPYNRSVPATRRINPHYWLAEPDVGRVAHGIPDRVDRLKGLGNAIVPQAVVPIMEAIRTLTLNPLINQTGVTQRSIV